MNQRLANKTGREETRLLLLLGLIALLAAIRLFTATSATAGTEFAGADEDNAPIVVRGLTLAPNGERLTAESEVLIDAAAELIRDFEPGHIELGYCEPSGNDPRWESEDYVQGVVDALGERSSRAFAHADPTTDVLCSDQDGRHPAIVISPAGS